MTKYQCIIRSVRMKIIIFAMSFLHSIIAVELHKDIVHKGVYWTLWL